MRIPGRWDIPLHRGIDTVERAVLRDGDGVAMDATGYTVTAPIYSDVEMSTQVGSLAVAWIDQTAGAFTLTLDSTVVGLVEDQPCYWQLMVADPGNAVEAWARGRIGMAYQLPKCLP